MPSRPQNIRVVQSVLADDTYQFWYCPGCREIHFFKNSLFTFNGSFTAPTFDPGYSWDNKCAGVIQLGTIAYDVCNHYLSEQEIAIPFVPRWFYNRYSRVEQTISEKHELQTL